MSETVLRNARLVFPHRAVTEGEIAFSGGRIEAIGKNLPKGDHEVDVHGALVGPGVVDPHTHLGIYRDAEADADTETDSAVRGGVTTLVTYWRVGEPYTDGLVPYAQALGGLLDAVGKTARTDFAVNLGMLSRAHLDEVPTLVKERGVTTLKYFTHYEGRADIGKDLDAGYLYDLMERVRAVQEAVPEVRLSVHCEDPAVVRVATERAKASGAKGLEAYRLSRPEAAEAIAIDRLGELGLATGAPLYLPHVSSALGLDRAQDFIRRGVDLLIETSLHYLFLTTESPAGLLAKVNPAVRRKEDVESLWRGVALGAIQHIGSDHASNRRADKEPDLWKGKPAFPGTGLLLPLLFEEGVLRRKVLSPEQLFGILAENNARAHGLFPRKGALAVGSDADVVVLAKRDSPLRITAEAVHSYADYTPYEGLTVSHWPAAVYRRGELVFDGQSASPPGGGTYLRRPLATGAGSRSVDPKPS